MSKIEVYGKVIDDKTRCQHYHSAFDIIAIKFKCCDKYYPCYQCHGEAAGHTAQTWNKDEWHTKAILCGNCKTELTIKEYMRSGNQCPKCNAFFNPNCSKHYHLYFQV
ncbi:MAG TPA: CHY zinc finger protein [Chitinophagaceae bacterium]